METLGAAFDRADNSTVEVDAGEASLAKVRELCCGHGKKVALMEQDGLETDVVDK